jgi:hypothetical protein
MQATFHRTLRFVALTFVLSVAESTVAHAEALQPVEVLKGKGLSRLSGSTWVLADEAVILKDVRRARGLSRQLRIAQEQQQTLERWGTRIPRS